MSLELFLQLVIDADGWERREESKLNLRSLLVIILNGVDSSGILIIRRLKPCSDLELGRMNLEIRCVLDLSLRELTLLANAKEVAIAVWDQRIPRKINSIGRSKSGNDLLKSLGVLGLTNF